jgi:hypothetical protein
MTVIVLGRDEVGTVAESEGMRYYLTECCGASAKGLEGYIGCRSCYAEIDPALGGLPDQEAVTDWSDPQRPVFGGFRDKPMRLLEVYGDGIPWDEWAETHLTRPTPGDLLRSR